MEFPLFGPLADSRKRRKELEKEIAGVDPNAQPEKYSALRTKIDFENQLSDSYREFMNEREAARVWALRPIRVFLWLGFAVAVVVFLSLKNRFFQ